MISGARISAPPFMELGHKMGGGLNSGGDSNKGGEASKSGGFTSPSRSGGGSFDGGSSTFGAGWTVSHGGESRTFQSHEAAQSWRADKERSVAFHARAASNPYL